MKKNIHILLAATLLFGATSCEDFLRQALRKAYSGRKRVTLNRLWPELIRSCTPAYFLRLCLVWTD